MARNFKKTSPCPVCHGYNGAYRKENRCKGFLSDGGRVYCQRVETDSYVEPFGVRLYLQPVEEEVFDFPTPSGVDIERHTSYPPTTNFNETYSQNNPSSERVNKDLTQTLGVVVERELVEYPGREGFFGWEPFSREMFVVRRDGVEVARDNSLLRLRGWVLESEKEGR